MTSVFNQISGDACCENACLYKGEILGCSGGVPWLQVAVIGPSSSTVKWINLENGDVVDVKPASFLTGDCASTGSNSQTCYTFGADNYSVFDVNGTKTYLKNDVVLTAQADIDAALALIATATYENLVACGGEVVPATKCKGAHYEQLTLVAGVAKTITHTFGLGDPLAIGYSVRGVDGSTVGDWPTSVRFINQTADTVDIIADGIGGVVDVALTNTECLSSVVTDGSATGGGSGTDSQTLTLTGTTLAISNGNSVDLGDVVPEGCCVPAGGLPGQVLVINPDGSTGWVTPSGGGTDSQTLTLTGTTLAISNGNSVDLAAAIKSGETLTVLGTPTWNSVTGVLSIPYTDEAGTLNTKTVVINPTFVVGNAQDLVGDTTGTVRNTITEVVSGGNTTYTIKSDLPLATSTPSGGPNGLVYDAARGGWYVDDVDANSGDSYLGKRWSYWGPTCLPTQDKDAVGGLTADNFRIIVLETGATHMWIKPLNSNLEGSAQLIGHKSATLTSWNWIATGANSVPQGTWKEFLTTWDSTGYPHGEFAYLYDQTNNRGYEIRYMLTDVNFSTPSQHVMITIVRVH